jgi:hypothetical protein
MTVVHFIVAEAKMSWDREDGTELNDSSERHAVCTQ